MVGAAMPSPMPFRSGWLPGAPAAANWASTAVCRLRGSAQPAEPGRVVHPGQAGVEPGAEELHRLGGRRVVGRQERGDLVAQGRGGVLARAGQHSGPPAT